MKANSNKNRVTLKDIAEKTGYSVNTVSRALRDKGDIGEDTRKSIRASADAMGYFSNAIASSLRTGYTKTVAAIVPDVSNPIFSITMKWAEITARSHGYDTFIINTNEDDALEREAIVSAINKKVDGILLCPAQNDTENVAFLRRVGTPFVLIGRSLWGKNAAHAVVPDDLRGGYLATSHLLRHGHRDILAISGPRSNYSACCRLEGYKKALGEWGLSPRPECVHHVSATAVDCDDLMEEILAAGTRFSALFVYNDLIAWRVWRFLLDRGYRVPEDCSIVGYDNIQSSLMLPFGLDTVTFSRQDMAGKSVELLMGLISGEIPPEPLITETLEVGIVEAGTVARRDPSGG